MSKKLIAGAGVVAGLAVALAPLATYAEAFHTDTLQLRLAASCSIAASGISHPATGDPTGTWGSGASANTLGADVANGATYANLGKTQFQVVCTGAKAWNITVATTALSGTNGNEQTIPYGAASTYAIDSTSYWNLTSSDTDDEVEGTGEVTTTGGTVATGDHSTASTNTDTFVVTYGAGISRSQAADTYTGTAAYTFTATDHVEP